VSPVRLTGVRRWFYREATVNRGGMYIKELLENLVIKLQKTRGTKQTMTLELLCSVPCTCVAEGMKGRSTKNRFMLYPSPFAGSAFILLKKVAFMRNEWVVELIGKKM